MKLDVLKTIIMVLIFISFISVWQLLSSDGGYQEFVTLQQRQLEIDLQIRQQQAKNDSLEKEVKDLQTGKDAIETLARQKLGMVGKDETFVEIYKK